MVYLYYDQSLYFVPKFFVVQFFLKICIVGGTTAINSGQNLPRYYLAKGNAMPSLSNPGLSK